MTDTDVERKNNMLSPGDFYHRDRESLLTRAREVLDWVATGKVRLRIGQTYSLAEAAQAHRDLESRTTVGKMLLLPG